MINSELAKLFYEMADLLEMKNIQWKPRAYRTAARAIENLPVDIKKRYKDNTLKEIPGVGESIEKKIIEFIKTGKIKEHEELIKSIPESISALVNIPSLGPKKIKKLYSHLKIKSIAD